MTTFFLVVSYEMTNDSRLSPVKYFTSVAWGKNVCLGFPLTCACVIPQNYRPHVAADIAVVISETYYLSTRHPGMFVLMKAVSFGILFQKVILGIFLFESWRITISAVAFCENRLNNFQTIFPQVMYSKKLAIKTILLNSLTGRMMYLIDRTEILFNVRGLWPLK